MFIINLYFTEHNRKNEVYKQYQIIYAMTFDYDENHDQGVSLSF